LIRVLAVTSILLPLYFLPAILGWRKRDGVSICVLDLLFGWTAVGWIVALVWAVSPELQLGTSGGMANATPSNSRRCHMCGKYSGAQAMCCPHCGTAFVPEKLRTAVRASVPHTEGGPSSPEEAPTSIAANLRND
jgi:hypothetical protein